MGVNGEAGIVIDRDQVTVVRLNNPAKRNAVSDAMWIRLAETFGALDADEEVRVIVLTGNEHFCAGADVSEFKQLRTGVSEDYERHYRSAVESIARAKKPVVAAIRGYCLGGGMSLALACDIRLSDETAIFGIPAAKLGIIYGAADCLRLTTIVGVSRAKWILFQAGRFNAGRAAAIGLVDLVEGDVLAAAREFGRNCAANAPLSVLGMKSILNAIAAGEIEANRERFEDLVRRALASADYREGVAAFAEKRPPRFTGR